MKKLLKHEYNFTLILRYSTEGLWSLTHSPFLSVQELLYQENTADASSLCFWTVTAVCGRLGLSHPLKKALLTHPLYLSALELPCVVGCVCLSVCTGTAVCGRVCLSPPSQGSDADAPSILFMQKPLCFRRVSIPPSLSREHS